MKILIVKCYCFTVLYLLGLEMIKSCLIFLLLSFVFNCQKSPRKTYPQVVNGMIDVSSWNFKKDGIVALNGEWEFYWKKLIKINSFENNKNITPKYILVPKPWNDLIINSKPISGDGYATYQLQIQTIPKQKLALKFPTVSTAYKLYINGQLFSKIGQVGTNRGNSKPLYLPQVVELPGSQLGTLYITIQVSNFHHKKGGLWETIYLGENKQIHTQREKKIALSLFLVGSLFIIGLYHIGLFLQRRKDTSVFWFGLFSLLFSFRSLITNEYFIYNLIPNFDFNWQITFEYLTICIGTPVILLFIARIFPKDIHKIPMSLIIYPSLIISLIVLFSPPQIFTHTLQTMQFIILVNCVYVIYITIITTIRKRDGAKSFFMGAFVFTLFIINDILHGNQIIQTGNYASFGFFWFIFSQAFLLSSRFSHAFIQVEELSKNLEVKVIERTNQLELAKNEAEKEREKSDKLLINILPQKVADELKEKGEVQPIYFESVSVLFTDFKGFTKVAESINVEDLVKELDSCFYYFDDVISKYNLEKIKTIGDSYMCAGGLPEKNNTHVIDSCLVALEIQNTMNQAKGLKEMIGLPYWELRLGIHVGPVIAGVVGKKKFVYDIWGDTVNTASRMESSGEAGMINISGSVYDKIKYFFDCSYRGKVQAKNKGQIDMYFLHRLRKKFASDAEGRVPNEKFREVYDKIKHGAKIIRKN